MTFQALVANQVEKQTTTEIKTLEIDDLPEDDVLVEIHYSSVNYKDGLAVTGKGRVIRNFPMVPGIDFAGKVVESNSSDYQVGEEVILTGWGIGEQHWGGYAGMARVSSDWLVPLPANMTLEQSMVIGTAGFTAMMCVDALQTHDVQPDDGEILVTGASGGVGSVAIAILAHLGFDVVGSTGRAELKEYLQSLGAKEIMPRDEIAEAPSRPLASEKWAGAVDSVGGDTLAHLLTMMQYGTSVAAVGLAGGAQLNTTVLPFILRGVNLLGIDSVMCPKEKRLRLWERLASDFPLEKLETMKQVISLEQVPEICLQILQGQIRGRVIVDLRN